MSDSPSSTNSVDPEIVFNSVSQVEELYDVIIEKYNDISAMMEMYEAVDDDIQELREMMMDNYDFQIQAEVYDALGEHETAKGLKNQAEECEERIAELRKNLENIEIKDHFYEMYELEIRKETYEVQLKACEKYLEKSKRKTQLAAKKATIRPASPRRFPKAASPSRLNRTPKSTTPPKQATPVKVPSLPIALPKLTLQPLPPPPKK
jgi:DNA repair exonuclease SbcCD ATPase subunit